MTIRQDYQGRYDRTLKRLAANIERHIGDCMEGVERIDRIGARAKSVDRFVVKGEKAGEDGTPKYDDPLAQIQDQVGARIIAFYLSDVQAVSEEVERYFRPVESKALVPDSEWGFGYFGKHYILILPEDVVEPDMDPADVPDFFELQVKTLFQHAWSEANHDLGYKPGAAPLNGDETRRLAFTAAQSWGADRIFDELYVERSKGKSNEG